MGCWSGVRKGQLGYMRCKSNILPGLFTGELVLSQRDLQPLNVIALQRIVIFLLPLLISSILYGQNDDQY